ncbi:MAG: hypothetical protein GWN55_07845 [Phycisphaerae bacterium]|nr:hypothetical protein [Phycisphaerae bacterium]NIU25993.1 hypothetical protein [candidate division KSB1 bacterium]NIS54788.1 hypothetical protein [Phycisphaerae bacterium]NIV01219.1 hypothetical protein [Phycisphaerae bacterium]NIV71118.1 hypothetical protein [Phycisphaerae bacterium]
MIDLFEEEPLEVEMYDEYEDEPLDAFSEVDEEDGLFEEFEEPLTESVAFPESMDEYGELEEDLYDEEIEEEIDLDKAVRRNRFWGKKLRWHAHNERIEPFLGFADYCPDEETFAQAVAAWQRKQGMKADGIIGPNTWKRMRTAMLGKRPSKATINLGRAVRSNQSYGRKLGWDAHYDQIESLLGFTDHCPDEKIFAKAVASWQRTQGLKADGIIGPRTWSRMRALLGLPPARVAPTSTTKPRWVRTVIPLLNRYRGDIPIDLLLGWIAHESGGNFRRVTKNLRERGYFQIHPGTSKILRLNHKRLSTNPEYSVRGGIKMVRLYSRFAQKIGFTYGSDLYWHIVAFLHAMGVGAVKVMLDDMRQHGVEPTTWETIKQYAASHRQRLHSLFLRRFKRSFDPVRWTRNVDKRFEKGKRLAAGNTTPGE